MISRRSFATALAVFPGSAFAMTDEEFRRRVREALAADPSILREAIIAMQQAEQREREEALARGLRENRVELFDTEGALIKGNREGRILIAEFYDVRCGFCRQVHPVVKDIVDSHADVGVIMVGFPILGPGSDLAERAIRAAHRRGRGIEMLDAMIEGPQEIDEGVVRAAATRLGFPWTEFRREIESDDIREVVARSLDLGHRIGIGGTPAFVIGDRVIPGAMPREFFEEAIAEERRRLGG